MLCKKLCKKIALCKKNPLHFEEDVNVFDSFFSVKRHILLLCSDTSCFTLYLCILTATASVVISITALHTKPGRTYLRLRLRGGLGEESKDGGSQVQDIHLIKHYI